MLFTIINFTFDLSNNGSDFHCKIYCEILLLVIWARSYKEILAHSCSLNILIGHSIVFRQSERSKSTYWNFTRDILFIGPIPGQSIQTLERIMGAAIVQWTRLRLPSWVQILSTPSMQLLFCQASESWSYIPYHMNW